MYDGGSDVTGYIVEILEEGTEQWYRATQKILSSNQYTVTGLASNKKYSFRVAAVNAMGTGEFSEGSIEASPSERVGKFFFKIYMVNNGQQWRAQTSTGAGAPSFKTVFRRALQYDHKGILILSIKGAGTQISPTPVHATDGQANFCS